MKKIFTLCSLILTLAIIITVFTACGGKKDTETTETSQTTEDNTNVSSQVVIENVEDLMVSDFTVQIGNNEAIVNAYGKFFQTLKYPHSPNKKFNKEYASEHYEFIDMNFDGIPDLYIAIDSVDGVVSYYCWIFNATEKKFEYSVSLSALNNLYIDATNQKIHVTSKEDSSTVVGTYQWVNGELRYEKRYTESDLPEEYTNVVKEDAVGVKPSVTKPVESTTENNKSDKADITDTPITESNKDTTTKPNEKPVTTTGTDSNNVQLAPGSVDEGWVNL